MTHHNVPKPIGERAMTGNERQKRYYQAHKAELLLKRQQQRAEKSGLEAPEIYVPPPKKPKRKPTQAATWPERRAAILRKRDPLTKRYRMS